MTIEPNATWRIPGVHVDPNTVDSDVDTLAKRVLAIQAEVGDLGAEALRIRDQHRRMIDEMKNDVAQARKNEVDAVRGRAKAEKALEFVANERDEREKERDAARKEHQEIAMLAAAMSAQHRATINRLDEAAAAQQNTIADLNADLAEMTRKRDEAIVATQAAQDYVRSGRWVPEGAEIETTVVVPTALVRWAEAIAKQLPEIEHPDGSYVVLPSMGGSPPLTLGELRAWLRAIGEAHAKNATVAPLYTPPAPGGLARLVALSKATPPEKNGKVTE